MYSQHQQPLHTIVVSRCGGRIHWTRDTASRGPRSCSAIDFPGTWCNPQPPSLFLVSSCHWSLRTLRLAAAFVSRCSGAISLIPVAARMKRSQSWAAPKLYFGLGGPN
ncbi:hypothetical protein RRG08_013927 [Elysia crispata]|uniref:Uncharacterized protein n=1 Tax=Elysia crispata TaxID=231223 RepID=A0AAE1DY75_9GAST|nr:hypothetical protein RRG08_013927 [Elysia crispata]